MGVHQRRPAVDIAAFQARWKKIREMKPDWVHDHTPEVRRKWDEICRGGKPDGTNDRTKV